MVMKFFTLRNRQFFLACFHLLLTIGNNIHYDYDDYIKVVEIFYFFFFNLIH